MKKFDLYSNKYIKSAKYKKASSLVIMLGYLFSFIAFIIIGYFIICLFTVRSNDEFAADCTIYDAEWTYTGPDGKSTKFSMPFSLDSEIGEPVTVSTILPDDITDGTKMCFLSSKNSSFYIDGELRYQYTNDENPIPGGTVKSHYMMVPLEKTDAGKTMILVHDDTNSSNGEFNTVYYGSLHGIYEALVNYHIGEYLAAFLLCIFSVMTIITGYILLIIYRHKIPIIMLAYGTLVSGLWFIFDSYFFQVVFKNYNYDGPMEYMLVMLMPYFYIRYINLEQERRYQKLYVCVCIILALNFFTGTILHFTGIVSYQNYLLVNSGVIVLAIFSIFITIFIDIPRKYFSHYKHVAIGFLGVLLASVLQIIILNTQNDVHNVIYLIIGVYYLLFMGIVHTVSEISTEEDLSRLAQYKSELKSSFLANMSHEIRTPLNAVLGMNEMILRETKDSEISEYANNIKSAGHNLLSIINDILDFSKIESGKMELSVHSYSLSELLSNVQMLLQSKATQKNLEFKMLTDDNVPDYLIGDDTRITQILTNVINNAIKYTTEGSVTLHTSVKNISELSAVIHFEISDTGIGIKDEDKDKLFNNFERLDIIKNRSIEGTGLGLSITHSFVTMMNGTINVESEYGKGSCFIIDIPQLFDHSVASVTENNDEIINSSSFCAPEASILSVDDVEMNLVIVEALLKNMNINVVSVRGGYEALEECSKRHFDIILMDHMMPEIDGIQTLHELKKMWSNDATAKYKASSDDALMPSKVIVLTANAIEGMKEMYLSEGFDDYITKPMDPDLLTKIVIKNLPREKLQKT